MEIKQDRYVGYRQTVVDQESIQIGGFSIKLTKMTAIVSKEQRNSLAWLLGKLMIYEDIVDMRKNCEALVKLWLEDREHLASSPIYATGLWMEVVRPLDLLMLICRLRSTGKVLALPDKVSYNREG